MPATLQKPKLRTATLRAIAPGGLRVDSENGIIYGAAGMQVGGAKGHPFMLDRVSLQQTADLINAQGGVKSRLKHPQGTADAVDTLVATIKNARIVGDTMRVDIHLGQYSKNIPGKGDVWSYLLSVAEENPTHLGLSAVIDYSIIGGDGMLPIARIVSVSAVDIVGEPAATRNGLLAVPTNHQGNFMDPDLKQYLIDNCGLDPAATDEQAQAFYDAMSGDAQAACSAGCAPSKPAAKMSAIGIDHTALAERKRVTSIRNLAELYPGIPSTAVDGIISANLSVGDAKQVMLKHLGNYAKPIPGAAISVGDDLNRASLSAACVDALQMHSGIKLAKPNPRAEQFRHFSVLEMARRYHEALGIDMSMVSRSQLARMILNENAAPENVRRAMLAQSTGSFTNVITSNFAATLRLGYQEQPQSWPMFAKRGTVPNFLQAERPILSGVETPVLTQEGGEIKYSNLIDKKEVLTLAKYTRGLRLTFEAITNDRLDAFSTLVQKIGQACKRLEDDLAFVPLTTASGSGQTMTEDGQTLFYSGHNNTITVTASIGAPSVTTLAAARTLLAKQVGLKSETLDLHPSFIIVPSELATVTEILVASMVNPALNNATPNAEFIRQLQVVSNARMSAASTTAWILGAGPEQTDGVEVAFLEDEPAPVIKQEVAFDTDDLKIACRHSCVARALDFRAFVRNAGA